MLLQCQRVVLKDTEMSHNEVYVFGSEPCRLMEWALQAVFCSVFSYSIFPVILMHAGLPYMGMPALCTQRFACPLPRSAQTLPCSPLCSLDYRPHFVRYGSSEVFFWVNEGQLT